MIIQDLITELYKHVGVVSMNSKKPSVLVKFDNCGPLSKRFKIKSMCKIEKKFKPILTRMNWEYINRVLYFEFVLILDLKKLS